MRRERSFIDCDFSYFGDFYLSSDGSNSAFDETGKVRRGPATDKTGEFGANPPMFQDATSPKLGPSEIIVKDSPVAQDNPFSASKTMPAPNTTTEGTNEGRYGPLRKGILPGTESKN